MPRAEINGHTARCAASDGDVARSPHGTITAQPYAVPGASAGRVACFGALR